MSNKAILYHIHNQRLGSHHVYSLAGGPVPGALRGLASWHCCSHHGDINPLTSFSPSSNSSAGTLSPKVGCEHLPLYLSGSRRASQETAISGPCQQSLPGIHNSIQVWWLYMGWIPRWGQSLDGLSFSLCSTLGLHISSPILFLLLRRTEASTLHPSFFLSFIWSMNCIFGILSFWGNIHLSMSAYYVCSFVTGLPHSGWYFLFLDAFAWEFHGIVVFNNWVEFHCVNVPHCLYPFLFWKTCGFCFQLLAVINKAARNIVEHVSLLYVGAFLGICPGMV
jgi:hypothetical protein